MDARRLVIRDAAGQIIRSVDLSDVDNADAMAVMTLDIETRCDMLHWHQGQAVELRPWGRALRKPDYSER